MIIAKIKDIRRYQICPEMENIIKYVEGTELDRLSYGVYELFPNVVLSVDFYETHEETPFVGHEKTISIHIIVDGEAKYSYADFNDDSIAFVKQYDEELDEGTYKGDERGSFILDKTMFMIVFPDDLIKYEQKIKQDNITKAVFTIEL